MKLDELFKEFAETDAEEALELVMEFGECLPPLSPGRKGEGLPATCRVQECQTPVYLWVDVRDGRMEIEAHVPENSPVVRGLVAFVVEALQGATPAEVLSVPEDILPQLHLSESLGMNRRAGLAGVLGRIKRAARDGSGSLGVTG